MKIWIIVLIMGLLAVATFVTVGAVQNNSDEQKVSSCSTCSEKCSAGSSCDNPTCAAKTTGSCNCGG